MTMLQFMKKANGDEFQENTMDDEGEEDQDEFPNGENGYEDRDAIK